jgi:DNA-binding transcriptional regulator GbsR (MarR family)
MPDTYLTKKQLKETEENMIICQDLLNNSNDEQEKKRLTESIERDRQTIVRLTEKLEKLKKGK